MNNNNRKRFNPYTQVQRWAVRVLLIGGSISGSSGSVLATQGTLGLFQKALVGVLALSGLKEISSFEISEDTVALRSLVAEKSDASEDCNECCQAYLHLLESLNENTMSTITVYLDAFDILKKNQEEECSEQCPEWSLNQYNITKDAFKAVAEAIRSVIEDCSTLKYCCFSMAITHQEEPLELFEISIKNAEVSAQWKESRAHDWYEACLSLENCK